MYGGAWGRAFRRKLSKKSALVELSKLCQKVLSRLLSRKISNPEVLDLWASSIWAQVSVYALADEKWHKSFRSKGVSPRKWSEMVRDHICEMIFVSLSK